MSRFLPPLLEETGKAESQWWLVGVTAVVVVALVLGTRLVLQRVLTGLRREFQIYVTTLLMTFGGVLIVLIVFAREIGLGSDTVQVLGAVVVGVLGLSSTTILGNLLAGLQLRIVGAFKNGDFLRVGDYFGRVTERGMFHTEIQTEAADLETLPNLFLVSNPYRVVQKKKTIISATVSLGYDVPRATIEACLKRAAEAAELDKPFVLVVELGDFSVVYRVGGTYKEVTAVLTRRSNLRRRIMDELFAAGIEIASPNLMDTRAHTPERRIMPPAVPLVEDEEDAPMERAAFDKADDVMTIEEIDKKLADVRQELSATKDEDECERLRRRIERLENARSRLGERLDGDEEA
ncbi:MAG: mechanosensitive ion channel family protein [bacterium]|nr:mechanosensitive ion channel family protein [bacterium]